MTKISVVMATYNGEEFIAEAIESILSQSFRDFEFIIVDDGSIDNTFSIISSYRDPRIKYIKKENNSGIADSLNIGIDAARGKYIARMDDDDISYPKRLKTQLEFLEENPDYILCASTFKLLDKSKNRFFEKQNHEDLEMKMLFFNPIVHPSVMIRTDVFESVRYNEDMPPSEDYDLWSRLLGVGKFFRLATPLLLYRSDAQSETTRRREEQFQLNVDISKRVFKKIGLHIKVKDFYLHKALIRHDYNLSFDKLPMLMNWLDSLITQNFKKGIYTPSSFYSLIQSIKKNYLISYFTNNNKSVKFTAFNALRSKDKMLILKYYSKNLFK